MKIHERVHTGGSHLPVPNVTKPLQTTVVLRNITCLIQKKGHLLAPNMTYHSHTIPTWKNMKGPTQERSNFLFQMWQVISKLGNWKKSWMTQTGEKPFVCSHLVQEYGFSAPRILWWVLKQLLCKNHLSHFEQTNGFSPVWSFHDFFNYHFWK